MKQKNLMRFLLLLLVCSLFSCLSMQSRKGTEEITVIYDDNSYGGNLQKGHGFSCLITGLEKKVLFDAGGAGVILMENMSLLGIDPQTIDVIVLSCFSWSHFGGLNTLIRQHTNFTLYVPAPIPDGERFLIEKIQNAGATVVEVEAPVEILPGVFSTGPMQISNLVERKEQSLVIDLPEKDDIVVITGCSRPGIVNILKKVVDYFEKDILLVLGGFHLFRTAKRNIQKVVDDVSELPVNFIAPCHCTGDIAGQMFQEAFMSNYIDVGVGKKIVLAELVSDNK